MPEGPATSRVEAQRRALTTPSTALASRTRWCKARNPTRRMRRSSGKDGHASGPDLRADHRLPFPGELGHDHVHAGGAFVRHVLRTNDSDIRHDQRWRERPRRGARGPPAGQDSGVVHAIVGSATATPTPVATAAQSAASLTAAGRNFLRDKRLGVLCRHGATRGETTSCDAVNIGGPT